jgi:hypothetical protein
MKTTRWFDRAIRASVASFTLLAGVGCTGLVVWASKEKASWQFIQQKCQGISIGRTTSSQDELFIPISAIDHLDSAICIYDARARLLENRILVSVRKGLCKGGNLPLLIARLPKPAPGDYLVAYDDPAANFPVIGTMHVE